MYKYIYIIFIIFSFCLGKWPRGAGPDGLAGARAARPAPASSRKPRAALRLAAGF